MSLVAVFIDTTTRTHGSLEIAGDPTGLFEFQTQTVQVGPHTFTVTLERGRPDARAG